MIYPFMSTLKGCLASIDHAQLKTSYKLGVLIDQRPKSLLARIYAAAIPVICLLGELIKSIINIKDLIILGYYSISSRSLSIGDAKMGFTHLCEHLRNISGIIAGLFIGLYSPQTARKLFLTTKSEKLLKTLTPILAARLYSLGYGVSQFFQKHRIDYRICSGTLLGAIRHKGIIPWDDDIDLMLHPAEVERCKELFENGTFQRETGLVVKEQSFTGGWQCFHPDSPNGEGLLKEIGLPFIDIFCTQFDANPKKITYCSSFMRNLFLKEYFKVIEWEKPKEYIFGPLVLLGVEDAISFITRLYGRDSMDFAYQFFPHDVMASIWNNPLSIRENFRKIWSNKLPRRAYIANKDPIEYDIERYNIDLKKINANLKGTIDSPLNIRAHIAYKPDVIMAEQI